MAAPGGSSSTSASRSPAFRLPSTAGWQERPTGATCASGCRTSAARAVQPRRQGRQRSQCCDQECLSYCPGACRALTQQHHANSCMFQLRIGTAPRVAGRVSVISLVLDECTYHQSGSRRRLVTAIAAANAQIRNSTRNAHLQPRASAPPCTWPAGPGSPAGLRRRGCPQRATAPGCRHAVSRPALHPQALSRRSVTVETL